MLFSDSSSAISSSAAEPLPLSLMPGPSTTESRCAPTTSTLSASPLGVSAVTFHVFASRSNSVSVATRTTTGPAWVAV
jgi:hypothetical protein